MKGIQSKILIIVCLLTFTVNAAYAQSKAGLSGTIRDAVTGEPLPGANIYLPEQNLGTITDLNGSYTLMEIPSGVMKITVSYLGYLTAEFEQEFAGTEVVTLDIKLEPDTKTLDEVIIKAQARGQIAAINQQLSSDQIKNVVSIERILEVPDANAAESLGRLPGISLQRSAGEGQGVIIRGLSPKYNAVQVNGVNVASTGFVGGGSEVSVAQDRGTDLSAISSENLGGIEVFKAITPDMYAGSIGGVVNLNIVGAREKPVLTGRIYGAYNTIEEDLKQYKGFVRGSRRFFDNAFGIQASFNAERRNRGRDRLTASFFGVDTQDDNEKQWLISRAGIEDRQETRERMGGSFILDWKNDKHLILLSNFLNTSSQSIEYRRHEYVDGDQTFVIPGIRDQNLAMMSNALRGEHALGGMKIEWNLAHSYSKTEVPLQHEVLFYEQKGFGEASREMNPEDFLRFLPIDSSALFRTSESARLDMFERRLNGKLDITFPVSLGKQISGFLKLGGFYERISRERNNYNGFLVVAGVPDHPLFYAKNWIDPTYDPGRVLNGLTSLGLVLDPQLGNTLFSERNEYYNITPFQGPNADYKGEETTYAGYLMMKLNYKKWFTLIPGVRYEQDDNVYNGYHRYILDNSWGNPSGELNETRGTFKDGYLFPMVHVKVKPTNWFDIRLAYTNTISRPNFAWRIPAFSRNIASNNWSAGIPGMPPALSENLDAYVSLYKGGLGLFSVGWFSKKIDNVAYSARWRITGGDEELNDRGIDRDVYQLDEKYNLTLGLGTFPILIPETSSVTGIEFDLQTNFFFLPGKWKNFVFGANFTLINSSSQLFSSEVVYDPTTWRATTVTGLRKGPLPQQPDYTANFTLGYEIGGLSARFSMFSQGKTLNDVGSLAPFDTYIKSFTRFDFSMRYDFNDRLTFLFNGVNIFNEPDTNLQSDTSKFRMLEYYGAMLDFGFQYSFL